MFVYNVIDAYIFINFVDKTLISMILIWILNTIIYNL